MNAAEPGWRALEERTRQWLEESYLAAAANFCRDPDTHRNYSGGRILRMSRHQCQGLMRKLKVFRLLDRLRFESVLDLGAGFDTYSALIRIRYGVPAYAADLAHCVSVPWTAPPFGHLDHAVTLSATRLPFKDGAFDVVVATEVLEHLVRPIEAIAEMMRVAKKFVVLTSLEFLSVNRLHRLRSQLHIDPRLPHVERNFLVEEEIEAVFGPDCHHENLFHDPLLPISQFYPLGYQEGVYGKITDVPALVAAMCKGVAMRGHPHGAMGVVILKAREGAEVGPAADSDESLARWLVKQCAALEEEGYSRLTRIFQLGREAFLPEKSRAVAAELLARLACPNCGADLVQAESAVRCRSCSADFVTEYGVPILYPTHWPADEQLETEVRDRLCGADDRRWRTVRRIMRGLRTRESDPGTLRKALWSVESLLGVGRPA